MQVIPHQMISASAGSGKTYQLTNRYIKLLALGVAPERIVALTFTRKAAGEIFDRIIKRLAESLLSDQERVLLCSAIELELTNDQLLKLLQQLIHAIPLLRIGTLDSFMSQVLRLFAFELGIQGGFELIGDSILKLEEQKVLKRVLSQTLTKEEKNDFLKSFSLATYGSEEKSVTSTMTQFIEKYHGIYLDAPAGELWGNPNQIWPVGSPWLENVIDYDQFVSSRNALLQYAATLTNKSYANAWISFLDKCNDFNNHSLVAGGKLFEELLKNIDNLTDGTTQIDYRSKTYDLNQEAGTHAYNMLAYMIATILLGRIERTRGIFKVIEQYEYVYNNTVRKIGKFSFRDIVQILNFGTNTGQKAPRITQTLNTPSDAMLYINYRMDGRYDHWMIDEFQDTSNAQWLVLSNLIDEIIQDTSETRSFFYVGDVKQAIYGWRGGDSRLFNRIHSHYKRNIEKTSLSKSWRSAPAIIDTVNTVFSSLPASEKMPEEVISRWQACWKTHETALQELPGFSALYELPAPEKGEEIDDAEKRYELTAALINEQRSINPSLSIAVLVRSGKNGQKLTDLLRNRHIPAVWEGDSPIVDNTVCAALLSLIKIAQHPNDTFSIEHVRMTPLLQVMEEFNLTFTTLPFALLQDIHQEGFEYTLHKWIDRCIKQSGKAFSDFTKQRIDLLLQRALEFDQQHNDNVIQFIDYVLKTKVSGTSIGEVRVLTIHKAKGLEFDAVILPDLQNRGLDTLGPIDLTTHFCETAEGNPEANWVYLYPPKDIVDTDPALSAHRVHLKEENMYEELCALYVALTRAKHALYLITTAQKPDSSAFYASVLLKQQLTTTSHPITISNMDYELLYQTGTSDWAQQVKKAHNKASLPSDLPATFTTTCPRPRLERHIPSDEEKPDLSAELLFNPHGRQSADFGTAMHALFEEITWLDETDISQAINRWRKNTNLSQQTEERVCKEFKKALTSPHVQDVLNKPDLPAEVWREKHFEIALDKRWISGCFDRVTIVKDKKGVPISAQILDYKSNRIKNADDLQCAGDHYRPQLELYREVLSCMLQLPKQNIALLLLFTHTGDVSTL